VLSVLKQSSQKASHMSILNNAMHAGETTKTNKKITKLIQFTTTSIKFRLVLDSISIYIYIYSSYT
jgi:hypothetical protein